MANGDARSVRVPFGGHVVWPNACCVCTAELPEASLRLEAYAVRWWLPGSWQRPVAWFELPLCLRCRGRRVILALLRGLGVVLLIAGLVFASSMTGRGLRIPVWAFHGTLTPLVLWLWWRFPLGPTIRVAEGAVVMTFRSAEFAQGAKVFDRPTIATVSLGPLADRELEDVVYAGLEDEGDAVDQGWSDDGLGKPMAAAGVASRADLPTGLTQRPGRRRLAVAAALLTTAALGLLSRRYPLPGFLAEYTGDAAYATAAFFLFALLWPRARTTTLLGCAFGFAAAVEASQLLAWPWLQELRATRLGGLLLGHGYQTADLAAYAVGALLAGCADVTFLRPSLPRPSGPDSLPDRSSRPTSGSGPAVHSENPR